MEITQYYPFRLAQITIKALDDKVIFQFKNPFHELTEELDYLEISPKVTRERTGESGWSYVGWFLIALEAPFGLLWLFRFINFSVWMMALWPISILAAVSFILRVALKYDYIIFRRITGQLLLAVRLHGKNRKVSEDMVEYLVSKIKQRNPAQNDAA